MILQWGAFSHGPENDDSIEDIANFVVGFAREHRTTPPLGVVVLRRAEDERSFRI